MHASKPAPADPGRDDSRPGTPPGPGQALPPGDAVEPGWEPVITRPDPVTEEEREAWLDHPGGPDPPRGTGGTPGPGFSFTATGQHGPPGGYGTWRLHTGASGQRDLLLALDPVTAGDCDHRFQARGHDPGVKLRHLSQVRHATCTSPVCRRPAAQCDFEHDIPYEAGGRTCLCNGTRSAARPPAQPAPPLARRPTPRWHLPLDHPAAQVCSKSRSGSIRAPVHHRAGPLPHLTGGGGRARLEPQGSTPPILPLAGGKDTCYGCCGLCHAPYGGWPHGPPGGTV